LVRVETARLAVLVFQCVGGNDPLPRADSANPADADPAVADHMLLDNEAFLAVISLYDARCAIAKLGVDVVIPQIKWFDDVTVTVNIIIGAGHRISSVFYRI